MNKDNMLKLDGSYAFEIGYSVAETHIFILLGYLCRQCPFDSKTDLRGAAITPKPMKLDSFHDHLFADEIESAQDRIDEIKESIRKDIINRDLPGELAGIRGKCYPRKGILFYRRKFASHDISLLSEHLKEEIAILSELRRNVRELGKEMGECFELGVFVGTVDLLAEAYHYFESIETGAKPDKTPPIGYYLYHFLDLIKRNPQNANISVGSPLLYVNPNDNINDIIFEAPDTEEMWLFLGEKEFIKKGIDYSELKLSESMQDELNMYLFDDNGPKSPGMIDISELKKNTVDYCRQFLPKYFPDSNILEIDLLDSNKYRCVYWKKACDPIEVSLGDYQVYFLVENIIDSGDDTRIYIPTDKEDKIENFLSKTEPKNRNRNLGEAIEKLFEAEVGIVYPKRNNTQNDRLKGFRNWLSEQVSAVFISIQ